MEEIIEEIPLTPLEPAKIYVHHYDKNTKEYLYKEEAEIDKQATKRLGYNVHLLPAYSTLKLVPEFGENEIPVYSSHTEQQTTTEQIPVYDEETGEIISYEEQEKITEVLIEEWTLKPDYRKNYYKVDDDLNVLPIDTIGEQEGFYLVDKATGDLIKENPDKYKISDGNVVIKTDEEYSQVQLEKAKQAKIAENEFKRQVEFINTHLGKLKTETPLGDLKTALPLYTVIATGNNGLPENAVRLYVNGIPQGSPALTLQQFNELVGEVAMEYVKIDQYSTQLTLAINNAKSIEELELITIDYDNISDLQMEL